MNRIISATLSALMTITSFTPALAGRPSPNDASFVARAAREFNLHAYIRAGKVLYAEHGFTAVERQPVVTYKTTECTPTQRGEYCTLYYTVKQTFQKGALSDSLSLEVGIQPTNEYAFSFGHRVISPVLGREQTLWYSDGSIFEYALFNLGVSNSSLLDGYRIRVTIRATCDASNETGADAVCDFETLDDGHKTLSGADAAEIFRVLQKNGGAVPSSRSGAFRTRAAYITSQDEDGICCSQGTMQVMFEN